MAKKTTHLPDTFKEPHKATENPLPGVPISGVFLGLPLDLVNVFIYFLLIFIIVSGIFWVHDTTKYQVFYLFVLKQLNLQHLVNQALANGESMGGVPWRHLVAKQTKPRSLPEQK